MRTVLWHCFGLQSASVYPHDLNHNRELEDYVGHIEPDSKGRLSFPSGIPLFKTHEPPPNGSPAIYVVRDGRAVCISLWEYYNRNISLEDIIAGKHRAGTWAEHLMAWKPWKRRYTLLIKYEDIVDNLPFALEKLERVLGREIISTELPDRNKLSSIDGRWVRKKSDWQTEFNDDAMLLFNKINRKMMRKMRYYR